MVQDLSFLERPANIDPKSLGREDFLLRPGHFSVIDGDTIWALSNSEGQARQGKSFSMRFRTIAAPERPTRRGTDAILKNSGIDPYWDSLGQQSTEQLKAYLDGRALLVQPSGQIDRYGRMLCDMAVVPYTGGEPDLSRAVSLERLMLSQKVANPFDGKPTPPLHPQLYTPPAPEV
ncbi:thermonuclease family protein [Sulfitobacter sp. 1A13353]|jgi:endonuclease YncB( thermonuclease family)|uniref:thermonuclease family protein n=1 Tax=Sulfitobacter sp. 1A13353 TaxID=3368568 RepID=UPI003745D5A3